MRTFGVDGIIRSEMMKRMSDGWHLSERLPDQMTMIHVVSPPWWRVAVEMINPLSWLVGAPSYSEVVRVLHVWTDTEGVVRRRTTGDIPPLWRRDFTWEVPDGPVSR